MLVNFIIVITDAFGMGNVKKGRFNLAHGFRGFKYFIFCNLVEHHGRESIIWESCPCHCGQETERGQRYDPKDPSLIASKVHLQNLLQSTNTSTVAMDQPIRGHCISKP